jgi:peptidyl-tRNA hydrolase
MNDWRNAVTGFGNLGLAGEDTRANLGMSAINADANVWNALGSGADKVLNPQTSMYDQFKRLRQEGII